MKKILEILLVLGIAIGVFSLVIPFSSIFSTEIENIIYFRGILLAGVFISIYSAVILKDYLQNIAISLGSGIVSLLLLSTYNLICDACVSTRLYFNWTLIIVASTLLILTIIRLCWNKTSQ